jgi:GNAT superfamily N-acetyltransferase
MAHQGWTIRQAVPDDRDAALNLLRRAFGRDVLTPRAWDWAFREHPSGVGMHYLVAEAGDRLVAQWAFVPTRLQHRETEILGLRGWHPATDPEYRGQGISTALGRQVVQEYGADAALQFGFPNEASRRITCRVGSVELRPFPLLIRPVAGLGREAARWRRWARPAGAAGEVALRALAGARGALGGLRDTHGRTVEEFDEFGVWADRLWKGLSKGLGTCAIRDADYLNWRFRTAPFEFRRLALVGRRGPEGFAVTATTRSRGRRIVTLMELMARPGDRNGAAQMIDRIIQEARHIRAAGIVTLATRRHPLRRELMAAGFLPAPWARGGSSFTARILSQGHKVIPNEVFHVDDWYVSGADQRRSVTAICHRRTTGDELLRDQRSVATAASARPHRSPCIAPKSPGRAATSWSS